MKPHRNSAAEIEPNQKVPSGGRVRLVLRILLPTVLLGMAIVWLSGVLDGPLDQYFTNRWPTYGKLAVWPQDGRPFFADSIRPDSFMLKPPPNATLKLRLQFAYVSLLDKLGYKNPSAWRFPASKTQQWDTRQLLQRCANITGKRYLISIEALNGTISFGHTNTLNGTKWVAAVETALRDQGILLVRDNGRWVKVVPKDKLERYRKAGLVKVRN